MQRIVTLLLFTVLVAGCQQDNYLSHTEIREKVQQSELFLQSISNLTEIQIHDIFSPPVASRIYMYSCVAAYEAVCPSHPDYASFAGRLHGLEPLKIPMDTALVNVDLAALYAFNGVAKNLIFSEDKMAVWQNHIDSLVGTWQINPKVIDASKAYADAVGKHIMAWSKTDNYHQTRAMPKFSVSEDSNRWKPTPPAYMEGVEPHWNKIRTLVLDAPDQFKPTPPPAFDMTEGSEFYNLVKEVYNVGNSLTDTQSLIANFWDCNPFKMNQTGHVMFASKKITPGGHWIGITGVACRKIDADLMTATFAHAMVGVGLFEAFISCWDEKYRSALVRPETVINEYIDPDWLPTLQTPPFPEHTSGHSVASTTSSIILTEIFGDNFAFVDDVEVKFGLPERSFTSFIAAAEEASISRMYGGIHYRPAIEDGMVQGRQVGNFITEKLLGSAYKGISLARE